MLPGFFTQNQKEALREVARMGGFENIETIEEEVAAATAANEIIQERIPRDSYILVFNLGEGACTLSLLDANLELVNQKIHSTLTTEL